MKFIKVITSQATTFVNLNDVEFFEFLNDSNDLVIHSPKSTSITLNVLNKDDVLHNLAQISGEYPGEPVQEWINDLLQEEHDDIYTKSNN